MSYYRLILTRLILSIFIMDLRNRANVFKLRCSPKPRFLLFVYPSRPNCLGIHVEGGNVLAPFAADSLDGAQLKVVEHP